jgi:hypothetical protein
LGSRQDPAATATVGRILVAAAAEPAVTEEVPEMADVAYVLVSAGGFALLAMVLRGLERL